MEKRREDILKKLIDSNLLDESDMSSFEESIQKKIEEKLIKKNQTINELQLEKILLENKISVTS